MDRTSLILFSPFSWKKWTKLVFIAWLAAALGSGLSFNGWDRRERSSSDDVKKELKSTAPPSAKSGTLDDKNVQTLKKEHKKKFSFAESIFHPDPSRYEPVPSWYMAVVVWPVVAAALLALLIFFIAMIWVSARFKFIWYHAVWKNSDAVRRPWGVYDDEADSFCSFLLLLTFLTLAFFAVVLGALFMMFYWSRLTGFHLRADLLKTLTVFGPLAALLLFSWAVLAVFYTVLNDFVVPIMAQDNCPFKEGLKKWLSIYRPNRRTVWRYFAMKFFAGLLAGFFQMAVFVAEIILFVLAGLVLFGAGYLLFVLALKMRVAYTVFTVLLGVPFLLIFLTALGMGLLPCAVFFRAFSLSFLSDLAPEYTAFALSEE